MVFTKGSTRKGKPKLAILVNTIAPYRLPMYASLAETFDTLVLHGGKEANRSWELQIPPSLQTREVWTMQIPLRKQTGVDGVWDTQYLHLNGGLLWWLPRFQPQAILTNELGLRTILALLYGRLAGVPVWVQWEGSPHSERNIFGAKKRIRRRLVRGIRHWVSYGAGSTDYLLSLGAKPDDVLEVQNCVPHQNFSRKTESPVNLFAGEPKPVILGVGQFIQRKGFQSLLEACGRLTARGGEFTLVLVGAGPEREALQTQAAELGIRHFHMLPNQTQGALNEIYRSADVFILPTLEDVWGLVVSEALWAGTPVLCSKYAGCAELVPEGNVFDPMSEESFDLALTKVMEGKVSAADPAVLRTCEQVGEIIGRSIVRGSPAVWPSVELGMNFDPETQGLAS